MSYDPQDWVVRCMTAMMSTLVFVVGIVLLISYYQDPKYFTDYDGSNIVYWYWALTIGCGIASAFFNYIMVKYLIGSFKRQSSREVKE